MCGTKPTWITWLRCGGLLSTSTGNTAVVGIFERWPDARLAEMQSRGACFPEGFRLPEGRLPLTEGKVHFICRVDARCAS